MAKILHRTVLLATASILLSATAAFAGAIHLQWDVVPGATGYRAYFGTTSDQYTGVQNMGGATSGVLTGLGDCTTYYISIKAYDDQGGISASFSNEVTGWARPEFSSMSPYTAIQGDQLTLDLFGANFNSNAQLTATVDGIAKDIDDNDLVILDDLTVVSCNQIQALVSIEPSARGLRAMQIGGFNIDFEVVNPDTVFGRGAETLQVELDESRVDINRADSDTRDRVDGKDLAWLAQAHGQTEGQPMFNPDADLDGDGWVDGNDLAMLAPRFGRCWNGSGWSDGACN